MAAVRVFICLVIFTTILAEEHVPCKQKYDKIPCAMCCCGKSDKHEAENDKALNDDEVSRSSREAKTETSSIQEVNNIIETTINTKIPETATTNNIETKPTESSQKVAEKDDIDGASSQLYVSYSPPTYAVHENVIDIADDRVPNGPIVANYTKQPQLNTVKPIKNTEATTGQVTEANIKNEKNLLSIEHIKVEISDKPIKENNNSGLFKGVKNYITGLQKGLLIGIHNFFHKKHKRSTEGQYTRNEDRSKQKSNNVDKTDFFVRRQHISLT